MKTDQGAEYQPLEGKSSGHREFEQHCRTQRMDPSLSGRSNLKRKRSQQGAEDVGLDHDGLQQIMTSPPESSVGDTIELKPLAPDHNDDASSSRVAINKKRRLTSETQQKGRDRRSSTFATSQGSKAPGKIGLFDLGASSGAPSAVENLSGGSSQDLSVLARQMNSMELESFRESITTNFSTRILYKHNELRLIDQEIAKCQVALEQLRRCSEIPYPSMTGLTTDMVDVSTGSGPSVISPRQAYPPTSPAPWGITDGPYTRHYAQWLIPDPSFDGGAPPPALPLAHTGSDSGTRSRAPQGGPENVPTSSRSRGQRGSSITVLQSLPSGYAQPKPERAAQIIKRHSDGMFVKLVCPGIGCGEERFNSVQGFINHCRIKHQIHFATHEDAAQRAGTTDGVDQKLGVMADATGNLPPPSVEPPQALKANPISPMEQLPPSRQPSGLGITNLPLEPSLPHRRGSTDTLRHATSPTTVRLPPVSVSQHTESKPVSGAALTHPYNRTTLDARREWPTHREKLSPPNGPPVPVGERQRRQSNMGPPISPAFVASDKIPFLSERFGHSGKAGNLQALVEDAQDRFDLDNVVVPEDVMDLEADTPLTTHDASLARVPKQHETVGGLGAPLMDRRPGSKKGIRTNRAQGRTRRDSSVEREDASFLSSTRGRRRRHKHEAARPRASIAAQDELGTPSLGEEQSHEMAQDGSTTPRLQSPFDRRSSALSASPVELSPGTHPATDTNQAPSLVSDDGQSGSEYEDDDEQDDDDDTPKAEGAPARISLGDADEMIVDSVGPSGLSVDDKFSRWNGSRSARSQHAS